jgi:hypothetical protein
MVFRSITSLGPNQTAEDEGFEPSVGCPTHAFQACALGRYANPPLLRTRLKGIGGDD